MVTTTATTTTTTTILTNDRERKKCKETKLLMNERTSPNDATSRSGHRVFITSYFEEQFTKYRPTLEEGKGGKIEESLGTSVNALFSCSLQTTTSLLVLIRVGQITINYSIFWWLKLDLCHINNFGTLRRGTANENSCAGIIHSINHTWERTYNVSNAQK